LSPTSAGPKTVNVEFVPDENNQPQQRAHC
jgi:hypothetical protein